jgi:hypothetical protein
VLLKLKEPVPSIVLLLAVVGLGFILQHTPLAVIGKPPSVTIVPPDPAIFDEIPLIDFVEREAVEGVSVVIVITLPYDVPAPFTANALK